MRRFVRRRPAAVAVTALGVAVLVLGPATPASAHPMGNFSVSQYHGLRLLPDRIEDTAVVDTAELPTLQDRPVVDADGDGTPSPAEQAAHAATQCTAVAAAQTAEVDGKRLSWQVVSSSYGYRDGAAKLQIARLHCELRAPAPLDRPATVRFGNGFRTDRIGWREITAAGRDGVRLENPPVPARSVTDELRSYPADPLAAPLKVTEVELRAVPGSSSDAGPAGALVRPGDGPISGTVGKLSAWLNRLVETDRLTVPVGLLAILVAIGLGVSHAALPGHGKAMIAAYLAGRRGGWRDAVAVGATVTATHTSGVLLVGLALTLSASLVGESVLAWLGGASGLLIAVIGAALLRSAWRMRTGGMAAALHGSHRHGPGHHHHHGPAHTHDHGTAHAHDHGAAHAHGHGHEHGHGGTSLQRNRWRYLLGMGVAGGLVPSPSALVVFLGAVGLGRTAFGIGLVVAYGLGMAAALTAAGLLLVSMPRRFADRISARAPAGAARLAAVTPLVTAGLVLVVGLGLVARSAVPLI